MEKKEEKNKPSNNIYDKTNKTKPYNNYINDKNINKPNQTSNIPKTMNYLFKKIIQIQKIRYHIVKKIFLTIKQI